MSTLLTMSKCLHLNCSQIQQLLHCFENAEHFGYFYNLDPYPGPGPWTLKTWTLKNLDPEKPEP